MANYGKNLGMAKRALDIHMNQTPSDTLSSETAMEIPEDKKSMTIGDFVDAVKDTDPQLVARLARALDKIEATEAPAPEAEPGSIEVPAETMPEESDMA